MERTVAKRSARFADGMLFAPEAHEGFLHDVLRVRERADKLAREKHEPGSGFRETEFPIFISGDILHDLLRVFHIETPLLGIFV